jgi:Pvc16 N-terminal domain/Carboxypeptidase regulatory-like domain
MRDAHGAAALARSSPPPTPERDVIDDVDLTLRRLLEDKMPRPRTAFAVRFDQPSENWQPSAGLNLNVYLYDVRENLELRNPLPRVVREPDGTAVRRQAPARMNLFYVVTAWSAITQHNETQILEEHRLLADVLRTLLRYPTLPRDVLQGALVGQEPPLPTLVAQMGDGLPHPPAEFWSALQSPIRPSLNLIVTISLHPASTDPPRRLRPVASEELTVGPSGGQVLRLTFRPPLAASFDRGAEVRAVSLASSAAGLLAAAIRASSRVLDVVDAAAIRPNTWIRVADGPNGTTSDYVRVPAATAPGPATLPVEPALRFAHASGVPVERLTIDVAKTPLAAAAAAGAVALAVGDRTGFRTGDIVMVDDAERTEFAQLGNIAPATGPGSLTTAQPLRYDHEAGRPLRVAIVAGGATALSAAANQPAQALEFAAPAPALPAGSVVMVGQGADVEFASLGPAGSPRPVERPLRGNHPVGALVRAVVGETAVARLAQRAAAGATEAVVGGDEAATLTLGGAIAVGTGPQASRHEITAIGREPGALADADRFVHVAGRVVDATAPDSVVAGATIVLVRPAAGGDPERALARARSDDEGRFQFRDVAAGSYVLRTQAARYVAQDKPVPVPSTRFDEYVVRLTPN